MDVVALDYYRIPEPDLEDKPDHYIVERDGQRLELPWGKTLQASSHVTPPGSLEYDPPKVRTGILQELADNKQLVHEGSP